MQAWPPPRTPGDAETGTPPQGGQYGEPGQYTGQYGYQAHGQTGYGEPGPGEHAYTGPGYGAAAPAGHAWWTPGRKVAAGGLALALIFGGGLAGGAVAAAFGHGGTSYASPTAVKAASSRSATGVAAIAQAVQPSTVSITVATQQGQDEGTGVIIRSDGMIMTNNHVVADAAGGGQITVKFSDGKKASADRRRHRPGHRPRGDQGVGRVRPEAGDVRQQRPVCRSVTRWSRSAARSAWKAR